MSVYYNEIDKDCCAWLKELMKDGFIPHGDVDDRSIKEVSSADVRGYTQCNFFSGIGVWGYALKQAGWPEDSEVTWTGSAPCQPFSVAGKQQGESDPRHLWPDFFRLIDACRPARLFGEQVSGKAGYGWLDGVTSDLESKDYACWAFDIPACAVDAPHIRNRLYWGASKSVVNASFLGRREGWPEPELRRGWDALAGADAPGDVADSSRGRSGSVQFSRQLRSVYKDDAIDCAVGDADDQGSPFRESISRDPRAQRATVERTDDTSFWSDAEWIVCHDGKARRTKPEISLLAARTPGRIPMWRALGNALCAPLAIEVVKAVMESEDA